MAIDTAIVAALIGFLGVLVAVTATYFYTRHLEEKKWERRLLEMQLKHEKDLEKERKKRREALLAGSHSFGRTVKSLEDEDDNVKKLVKDLRKKRVVRKPITIRRPLYRRGRLLGKK